MSEDDDKKLDDSIERRMKIRGGRGDRANWRGNVEVMSSHEGECVMFVGMYMLLEYLRSVSFLLFVS